MVKVNSNKWEEIKFSDIRRGDMIRTINTHAEDEGVADIRKRVKYYRESSKQWVTKSGSATVTAPERYRDNGANIRYYRRKPKHFEFPTKAGAVIRGTWKNARQTEDVTFIHVGYNQWVSLASYMNYTPQEVLCGTYNLKVLSEGIHTR